MRKCGDCQLCCKLLPVRALAKGANETCKFQKFHKGCTVYRTVQMPMECSVWNCRWLVNDDTADLSRPDRSHYVVDIMPDFITAKDNETGELHQIQIVQVWVDPAHREAHRDPALRAYLFRRAEEHTAALIRFNSKDAFVLLAPPFNASGKWIEMESAKSEQQHSFREIERALGPARLVTEEDEHAQSASGN
jgi:hypothetical protein